MVRRTPVWTIYQPTGQFIEPEVELVVIVCTKLSKQSAEDFIKDRPDLRYKKGYADNQ